MHACFCRSELIRLARIVLVCRLHCIYPVEEDVGCLEVPVDDLLFQRVQEGEAARRACGDLEPSAP